MRVVSFNIQAGINAGSAFDYVFRGHQHFVSTGAKTRTLKDIGAYLADFDLVCLQEVDFGGSRAGFRNQLDLIQDESGHGHRAELGTRKIGRISHHGNAILSRHSIDDVTLITLPGKIKGRGAIVARINAKKPLTVICLHLSLGEADQMAQLTHIGRAVDLGGPVIICGDFNCARDSVPLRRFCKTFEFGILGDRTRPTYPSWRPVRDFDHILINWTPKKAGKLDTGPATMSDHLPVAYSGLQLP